MTSGWSGSAAADCRALEPGLAPACAAGVHAPGEAAVDPRPLIAALATAVERRGGEVLIGAEVTDALLEGGRLVGVVTADGREHRADRVVLATGAWSGTSPWLPPEARPPVRPVKGQILTLRGAPDSAGRASGSSPPNAFTSCPAGDGRLVVGATVEERGFDIRVTAGGVHELLREAYRALPEIAELELVEALGGRAARRPPTTLPLIGPGRARGAAARHRALPQRDPADPAHVGGDRGELASERPPEAANPAHPGRFAGLSSPGLAAAPALEEQPR